MKSQWYFVAVLFFFASGANANGGITSLLAHTPISQTQAQRLLDAVIAVGRLSTKPILEVVDNPSYAIASVNGVTPRIVVSRSYLASMTQSALQFAFAHELAHLHLNHHSHIHRLRSQDEGKLAVAPGASDLDSPRSLRNAFHAIEINADQLAMQWCVSLGCTVNDAARALSGAYGLRTTETETHPALETRIHMLRFHHEIP